MSIQKCLNCGKQFSWKEIQKYQPIECKKCGTKHNDTMKSRSLFTLFAGGTILIVDFINFPFKLDILVSVTGILSIGFIYPYFAKYKVKV